MTDDDRSWGELREFVSTMPEEEKQLYLCRLIGEAVEAFYADYEFLAFVMKADEFNVDDGREGIDIDKMMSMTNVGMLGSKDRIMEFLDEVLKSNRGH